MWKVLLIAGLLLSNSNLFAGNGPGQSVTGLSGNPGFENGTTGYSFSTAPPFTINTTATYIRSGAASLRISTTSTGDIKAWHTAGAITAPAAGYMHVIAYLKGENTSIRAKVAIFNSTTSTESSAASYTTAATGSFTMMSGSFACTSGQTYYPGIFSNAISGTGTGEIDDIVIYYSTSSTVDATAPATAPSNVQVSMSGTTATLSWTAGGDAESGVEGYMIVRVSGISTSTITPLAQVNYSTTATEGPTSIGTATVIYNGTGTTTTDNPGTGSYTYLIYTCDKAFNYTAAASAARVFSINGSSLNGTLPATITVDGLYIAPTCSLTVASSTVLTIRSGTSTSVNGTIIDNGGVVNSGTLTFLNGSTYIFDRNSVSTPVVSATWNSGSTTVISGVKNFVPTGFDQTFANILWSCPLQNRDVTLPASFNVTGTFTIVDTDTRSIIFGNNNNISGSIVQSGGTLTFTSGFTLTMNGTSEQIIKVTGPVASLTVNNAAGVKLGGNLTVSQTLALQNGVLSDSTFALTMASGSTINRSGGTVLNTPTFAGTINIIYSGNVTTANELPAGNITNLTLNTSSAVTLNRAIAVSGVLTFTSGDLITTNTNLLTMNAGSSVSGASNSSHVSGPVMKTGNTAFTFPIGNGLVYLPLSISAPATLTDQYTALYTRTSPSTIGTTLGVGIVRVSSLEMWTLARTTGTSTVSVTLAWNSNSVVSNLTDLRVARWSGTQWISEGNAATSGTTTAGTVTSTAVTGYGTFTLGTVNLSSNQLPVTLVSFKGNCDGKNMQLEWVTASENNNDYFSIARSRDGVQYETLAKVKSAGNFGTTYRYTDALPQSARWYYKLNQTDLDGKSEELSTLAGTCGRKQLVLSVYNSGEPVLRAVTPTAGNYNLRILSINGQKLIDREISLEDGTNLVNIGALPLDAMLVCILVDEEGNSFAQRFVLEN